MARLYSPGLLQSGDTATQRVMSSSPLIDSAEDSAAIGENELSNIFGAFGTVLGYIGAEAATSRVFESLLWPQRSFSNFRPSQTPWRALLRPMGGPMHKAALKVFDVMYGHDLFNGPNTGHMLGTAFFPELQWSYTMHGQGLGESHTEPLRNCIWARAMSLLPMFNPNPKIGPSAGDEEAALKRPHGQGDIVRARFRVNHLTITKATARDKQNVRTFVHESPEGIAFRTVMAIFASELTAVATGVTVAVCFRTPWAVFWILPLVLRLISALLAVEREGLTKLTSSTPATEPHCDFEVHSPETHPNFLVMTGPPAVVLQFVRHYGHPKRNRFREVVQLSVVVAFAALFPLQLVCSTIWMSVPVQNIWLCYQLYCVLAMHVTRYSRRGSSSDTAEALAEALSKDDYVFDEEGTSERCILFGHTRDGHETLKISLRSTYHRRYKQGREALDSLITRRPSLILSRLSSSSSSSEITLAGSELQEETFKKD